MENPYRSCKLTRVRQAAAEAELGGLRMRLSTAEQARDAGGAAAAELSAALGQKAVTWVAAYSCNPYGESLLQM